MSGSLATEARRRIDVAVLLIALAALTAGAVGLPLYGDGAYYFFHLVLDREPLVPNLRWTAVLGQLPALAALPLTDDLLVLRHAFAVGYALLPWLSLAVCWLLVRRRAPWLLLFPGLALVAHQVNFSGVSELLLGLFLVWPFVLATLLARSGAAAPVYGLLLGPLLLLLHPLAFGLALPAAALAWWSARQEPARRRTWQLTAAVLGTTGAMRLLWTLLGSNSYERSRASGLDAVIGYLFPGNAAQLVLLGLVLALGLVIAGIGRRGRNAIAGRALSVAFLSLPLVAGGVGALFLAGDGIKLKAGLTFVLGIALMALAVVAASGPGLSRRLTARLLTSCAAAIVVLMLAKSAAWWTATHGLRNIVVSSDVACVSFGPEQPFSLQWPWMAVIDDWATPMNALIFSGPWPAALLLPDDGCERLAATGTAHLTSWLERPAIQLVERFGPLRGRDAAPE